MKIKFDFSENGANMEIFTDAIREILQNVPVDNDVKVNSLSVNVVFTDEMYGYIPEVYVDNDDGDCVKLGYVVRESAYKRKVKNCRLYKQLDTINQETGEVIPLAFIYEKFSDG